MVQVVPRQVGRRLVASTAGSAHRGAGAAAAGVSSAVAADSAAAAGGLDRGRTSHQQSAVRVWKEEESSLATSLIKQGSVDEAC